MKDQENHCSVFAAYKSEPMDIDHNETLPAVYDASLLPAVVGMSTTEVIDSCVDQMVSALHTKCDAMLSDATIKQQDMIEMQQLVSRCKGAIVLIAYYIGRLLAIVKKKRLYRDIGYDSFECYTSAELRIKHSQAAKYIAIAKKLPQDLASQLAGIGLENAYRLLSLDIEVIEEFVHDHDLDHMTVKQALPLSGNLLLIEQKLQMLDIGLWSKERRQQLIYCTISLLSMLRFANGTKNYKARMTAYDQSIIYRWIFQWIYLTIL